MKKQTLIVALIAFMISSGMAQPRTPSCVCPVQQATVTLTDDQIKSLPTMAVEVVPAPGANKMILPINGLVYFHWSGNYGNIDANAALDVSYANGYNLLTAVFENDGSSSVSNILNDDEDYMAVLTPRSNVGIGSQTISRYDYPPNFVNKNLTIGAYNGFNGNFTGGNSSNRMTVIVFYEIIDI